MKILAISGSLRRHSSNTTLLRAAVALAPNGVEIAIYDGLADLPAFNPDIEDEEIPSVLDYRDRLKTSDALLISSPEYAHGVPGALKNALDWVVGSGELVYKPVALWNPSPHSAFAVASLTETLTVMTANLVPEACVTVALAGKKLDEAGILANPEISRQLLTALNALIQECAKSVSSS